MACPEGLEPPTPSLEGWCSIQLSYGQLVCLSADPGADRGGFCEGKRTVSATGNTGTAGREEEGGRGGGIRTRDLLVPNQLRYQAALRPEQRAL